jgi:acetyl esterase/lipase
MKSIQLIVVVLCFTLLRSVAGMAAYDYQAPVIKVTQKPASVTNSNSAKIAFTVSDNSGRVMQVTCSQNGTTFTSCSSPVVLSGLSAVSQKFYIRARDYSNNVSTVTITWKIDTTPPTAKITLAPAALTTSTTAAFTFIGSDGGSSVASFQCSLDSSNYAACTSPKSYSNLSYAVHSFAVRAIDAAGNVGVGAAYNWTIAQPPPPDPNPTPNSFITDTETYRYKGYFDLAYGPAAAEKLDIYVPVVSGQTSFPVLIYIHGGAWMSGDKTDAEAMPWLRSLAKRGFAIASLNYRLVQNNGTPQIEDLVYDVKGALRWLRANAATYMLNPDYFFVTGDSAGGHLSSLLATTVGMTQLEGSIGGNLNSIPKIVGLIDFYGPVDLIAEDAYMQQYNVDGMAYVIPTIFGNCSPQTTCRARAELVSAYNKASIDDPPTMIINGTADDLVPLNLESVPFYNNLAANGVPVRLLQGGGFGHDSQLMYYYFDNTFAFLKNIAQDRAPF